MFITFRVHRIQDCKCQVTPRMRNLIKFSIAILIMISIFTYTM